MTLDIIMQPYQYLKMISSTEKKRYDADLRDDFDALISFDGGESQKAEIQLRGHLSLANGFETPAKRIPLEIRLDPSSAEKNVFNNPRLKLISCKTPALLFTEFVAMQAFQFLNIPTPCMVPVFVRINGENYGLFLLAEEINEYFLQKHYDASGSLYKGGNDDDKIYSGLGSLQTRIDHGSSTLDALVYAIDTEHPIEPYLNVDEFLRFLTCEIFTHETDGFITMYHNYYLYEDHGQFVFLPWDKNMTFNFFEGEIDDHQSSIHVNRRFGNLLMQKILQNPDNEAKFFAYLRQLNDIYLNPSTFLPWLKQFIREAEPYLLQDPTIGMHSDSIYEDLTTGNCLFNECAGNLILTFEQIHRQIDMQLTDPFAVFALPEGCDIYRGNGEVSELYTTKEKIFGKFVILRICAGYWQLRRQAFWQEYSSQTVVVSCVFAVFAALAVLSVRIPKGGMRRRKKREDVWNE